MLIVDAAAVRMLNLLELKGVPAAMNTIEGNVPEREREYLLGKLENLQALLRRFVEKYELKPSKRNLRRILAADASQIWVTLEDCRPARIIGYGALSASDAQVVETDLQEMLRIANGMCALLDG